jgi:rRNA-processing protein FCF1
LGTVLRRKPIASQPLSIPPTLSSLPKSPIVDTNVLFDFLVWRFHTETHTDIHPSLLHHLSSKHLEALVWYFNAAKPMQTAFHVIAELHGLTKKKPDWTGPTRESFWRFARRELSGMELGEHAVTIVEMDPEDLAQLGPTDASIVVLAIRLDAVVLTEDGRLRERCSGKEIRVLNYDRVLELRTQSSI